MNLLLTGAWNNALKYIHELEQQGHCVRFLQYEKNELPCDYEWIEGTVCNGLFLYHPIEKFINLKFIQLTSAGFDRVPLEYIEKHGIKIHNAHGVYSIPMAEFAVGGVLQLYKQARFFIENQKQRKWEKHRGLIELYQKTVCIVGCGSVGTECAKRFEALGCEVIGVDLFPRDDKNYSEILDLNHLDKVLKRSDIVILTLPLTKETYHLLNAEKFASMKPGAVIVNIARGAIVDTEALITALQTTLSGAVLDVFEDEPLKESSPLWTMPNVILTPHNSFVGDNNSNRLDTLIFDNLQDHSLRKEDRSE